MIDRPQVGSAWLRGEAQTYPEAAQLESLSWWNVTPTENRIFPISGPTQEALVCKKALGLLDTVSPEELPRD
jgi:hypothetical protein